MSEEVWDDKKIDAEIRDSVMEIRDGASGSDIERLNAMYRLSGLDVNYAYGLSSASYQRSVMDYEAQPVENVSLAILTRYFSRQPKFLDEFLAPTISPWDIYKKFQAADRKLTARQFAILLGRNASYAARAIEEGFELNRSTPIGRLLMIIDWDIEKHGAQTALERLRALSGAEARGRGLSKTALKRAGSWGNRPKNSDKKPRKPRAVTKTPLVNVQLAGQMIGEDAFRILTAPVPSGIGWDQPIVGVLGLFGTGASVLDVDIIGAYHEWPVRETDGHIVQYGDSVEPNHIRQLVASFKFEHEVSGIRIFPTREEARLKEIEGREKAGETNFEVEIKNRRWLDLRSMSEKLGEAVSDCLGVPGFTSWAMKKGVFDDGRHDFLKRLLNPAEFEEHIDAVEDLLGPLDIIIFPVNAQNRTAPVYAWVRRKKCLESITGRGLPKDLEILWDEKIDWAD